MKNKANPSLFILSGPVMSLEEVIQSTMLIGEYKHNIDNKKRLAVPAKLRKDTGDKVVIT